MPRYVTGDGARDRPQRKTHPVWAIIMESYSVNPTMDITTDPTILVSKFNAFSRQHNVPSGIVPNHFVPFHPPGDPCSSSSPPHPISEILACFFAFFTPTIATPITTPILLVYTQLKVLLNRHNELITLHQ